MARTSSGGGAKAEPALAGRVLFATGLLEAAWLVIVDPEPSVAVTVVLFAAPAASVVGGSSRPGPSRWTGRSRTQVVDPPGP